MKLREYIYGCIFFLGLACVYYIFKDMDGFQNTDLKKRYMICIPQSGIVDICTVIMECIHYCEQYNRILIIDTTKNWFNDDIHRYLTIHNPHIYTSAADTITYNISHLNTYPHNINIQNLNGIQLRYSPKPAYFLNNDSLTINLDRDYSEDIIVFSNGRMPSQSPGLVPLLEISTFSREILDLYKLRRSQLPQKYIGVHIRNTDYKSDLSTFINENHNILDNNVIFLASDNKDTIDEMMSLYRNNIFTFANIPANNGKPIHEGYKRTKEESHLYIIDTFVDILLLANADTFIYSSKESGFSKAVEELHKNPDLIKKLLNAMC